VKKLYRQSKWNEPLIFELSRKGAIGHILPTLEKEILSEQEEALDTIPKEMRRKELDLPELSELEVIRHFTRLSQMNYGVSLGTYPLGSCTMKYNPVVNEKLACLESVQHLHPLQDQRNIQGSLEILYKLEKIFCEITGMHKFSFVPAAGAQGEFLGCLIMKEYHQEHGEKRRKVIVPDSAHGTNPASVRMAGFEVDVVKSDETGCVDINELQKIATKETAGMMLTNPNTLGIFEKNIKDIVQIIHDLSGVLYYDGANLNPIMGKVRPGDMGFDIVHLNVHKTFSTPHGGGGPGAGPVGVKEEFQEYLPTPTVEYCSAKKSYYLDYDRPKTVGKIKMFHGNFPVYVKTYAYILMMGAEGLRLAAEASVLGSNYLLRKLREFRGVSLPFDSSQPRKHEFVLSLSKLAKETGAKASDVAKRFLDYGIHAPTTYFPLTVDEAIMIEPTESEPKRELDNFAKIMSEILNEAYENPSKVVKAPHNTSVARINEAKASHPRTLCLSWKMYKRRSDKTMQPKTEV
jgi:glycine dehydrogenase subunit 2